MIWSVSLILYHKHLGLLVGEEYRWKEGLRFHLVGGKVEPFDEDPVAAAAREFIEETNLLAYEYLQEVHMKNLQKWAEKNPITLETQYPHFTSFTQKIIEEEIRKTNLFFDHKVSENGKEHRYYFLNVHTIKNKDLQDIFLKMAFEYSLFDISLRSMGKMWSLHWVWPQSFYLLPNRSALFVKFTQFFYQLHFQHKLFPTPPPPSTLFKHKPKIEKKKDEEKLDEWIEQLIDDVIEDVKLKIA